MAIFVVRWPWKNTFGHFFVFFARTSCYCCSNTMVLQPCFTLKCVVMTLYVLQLVIVLWLSLELLELYCVAVWLRNVTLVEVFYNVG